MVGVLKWLVGGMVGWLVELGWVGLVGWLSWVVLVDARISYECPLFIVHCLVAVVAVEPGGDGKEDSSDLQLHFCARR